MMRRQQIPVWDLWTMVMLTAKKNSVIRIPVWDLLRPEEITDSDEIIIGTPEGDNMSVPI